MIRTTHTLSWSIAHTVMILKYIYIPKADRYMKINALIRKTFLCLLDAVENCYRLGIYHRDFRTENILVSGYEGDNTLLTDFGLATTDAVSFDHRCKSTFHISQVSSHIHCLPIIANPYSLFQTVYQDLDRIDGPPTIFGPSV